MPDAALPQHEPSSTPAADIARPVGSHSSHLSRLERVARSGFVTAFAAVAELAELAVAGAVVDLVVARQLQRNPYIDHGFQLTTLVGALAVVGYLLVAVELVARHRVTRRGFVLPLVFVPLGRAARNLFVLALCLVVLVPKLVVYFLALTVGIPVIALLRRLGASWATRMLDSFDVVFEHVETAVNHVFNALFYNPIEARGSAFTALFNLPLTLWCLNH